MAAASCRLSSQLHHIVLPPLLPGQREKNLTEIENSLNDRLVEAAKVIRNSTSPESYQLWDAVRRTLLVSKTICLAGAVNSHRLIDEFGLLPSGTTLILHVAEQNAGLLIRRNNDYDEDNIIFEGFEVSPTSKEVLAAAGALQWDFFSSGVVAVPYSTFTEEQFQKQLALFLEQCSAESIKRFASFSTKAGTSTYECRDTVDPAVITTMLVTLLEALGDRVYPPIVRKRIRDDVLWSDCAEMPWRRSPRWLVLRVGLLRHLTAIAGHAVGRIQYKFLMCVVLVQLLEDSVDKHLLPELITVLKGKLARRLAKLEEGRSQSSGKHRNVYDEFFNVFSWRCERALKDATSHIDSGWEKFRNSTQRKIPTIPQRAQPTDMFLSLQNSSQYLKKVLWHATHFVHPSVLTSSNRASADQNLHNFANQYFNLSDIEAKLESEDETSYASPDKACIWLSTKLDNYLDTIDSAYCQNPEHNSIMVLTVMEVWSRLDKSACAAFELLGDFHPAFDHRSLDALILPSFKDMQRLNDIQNYLSHRIESCSFSKQTIFDDPAKDCFAEKYFNDSTESGRLQELYQTIQQASEQARAAKEVEWREMRDEFESNQQLIAESTCVYTTQDGAVIHDDKHCRKCYLRRASRRMRIKVHEHFLPTDQTHAKAAIFELCCPPPLVAYRNVTWRIIATLGRPPEASGGIMQRTEPKLRLGKYKQLSAWGSAPFEGVGLASITKSFLATHYHGIGFPTDIESVCRPNGLKLRYHDAKSSTWTGSSPRSTSFAHLCQMIIPPKSPFAALQHVMDSMLVSNGPSSNEVIASQTKCPLGLNIHEYMAFQSLCSGTNRRWTNLLVELGSSNLNFSKDETTLLVRQIATNAGPGNGTSLRSACQVFLDDAFRSRLVDQLSQRLRTISLNWREHNAMESLLTLALRLISLGPYSHSVMKLLQQARSITLDWTRELRKEIHTAKDPESSRTYSRYALWAALLCRRTFFHYLEREEPLDCSSSRCFVECSISLPDNFDRGVTQQPLIKNALIRDLKMVYRMRHMLHESLQAHPNSLTDTINDLWPHSQGTSSRAYASAEFLEAPYEWWIQLQTVATNGD